MVSNGCSVAGHRYFGLDSSVDNVGIQRRQVNTGAIIPAAVEQGASGIGSVRIILQLDVVK